MTNLGCCVSTCMHNQNRLCCLKEIEVSGKGALNSDMTCCCSFAKEQDSASNALHENPEKKTGIKCSVENCAYNQHCYCTANSVDIIGAKAMTSGQTECSTFKQR